MYIYFHLFKKNLFPFIHNKPNFNNIRNNIRNERKTSENVT